MPVNCAVAICGNIGRNMNVISYFSFPKDPHIRKIWIHNCYRKDIFNPNTSYVCSEHFGDDDFKNFHKVKLVGGKLFLKKDVVPTLKLQAPKITIDTNRSKRFKKSEQKDSELINCRKLDVPEITEVQIKSESFDNEDIVPQLISHSSLDKTEIINILIKTLPFEHKEIESQLVNHSSLDILETNEVSVDPLELPPSTSGTQIDRPEIDLLEEYRNEINLLRHENNLLKQEMLTLTENNKNKDANIKSLNKRITFLNGQKSILKRSEIENGIRGALEKFFTPSQLDLLLKEKKRVTWSDKDIAVAFTLRYYSKRCYIYLRQKLHYPLPALGTLRRWAKKINKNNGVLNEVLKVLEIAGKNMKKTEKLVVLQYNEMKAEKIEDQINEPCTQLQIVNVKSLIGKWKEPIFSKYDENITKDILIDLIKRLHNIDFHVVALVSDFGPNSSLWSEYDISSEKNWIKHPIINSNIYIYTDASNVIKLIRKRVVDAGVTLEDGV